MGAEKTYFSEVVMLKSLKSTAGRLLPLARDYRRVRYGFKDTHGHVPNILFARTFSEKIQRRKLFDRSPDLPLRVDKIEVKEFVRRKLGDGWTTPTIWHADKLPVIAERVWPLPFVLKGSHGSGMNIFVRNENERDWERIEGACSKWLNIVYGDWGAEWIYSKIAPRLLVEPFIGEMAALPIDYKLWTFDGRVEFIQVDTDRENGHKRTMFDRGWNRLPFSLQYEIDPRAIDRPRSLSQMIEAAEALSERTSFVRVDFYEIGGRPLFGELTYYPGSGWEKFDPPGYDRKVGDLWP